MSRQSKGALNACPRKATRSEGANKSSRIKCLRTGPMVKMTKLVQKAEDTVISIQVTLFWKRKGSA